MYYNKSYPINNANVLLCSIKCFISFGDPFFNFSFNIFSRFLINCLE